MDTLIIQPLLTLLWCFTASLCSLMDTLIIQPLLTFFKLFHSFFCQPHGLLIINLFWRCSGVSVLCKKMIITLRPLYGHAYLQLYLKNSSVPQPQGDVSEEGFLTSSTLAAADRTRCSYSFSDMEVGRYAHTSVYSLRRPEELLKTILWKLDLTLSVLQHAAVQISGQED